MDNKKEIFLEQIHLHEKQIFKICHLYTNNNSDRQDLYQEIILQLWKSFPNFRGDAKFNTWLYQIAINTAIAGINKNKKQVLRSYPHRLPEEMPDPHADDELELFDEMYRAIEQHNNIEKAIVVLYIDGKNYADIEEILGINESTLRVKMNRIKKKLREITKKIRYGIG